ncbi:testis-specific gene 10 protein-like [Asterias rubens]|uniref:testis-specific gene 10 protein-like n=1 Tax=Asterias rubens TaxID=7604 RepID=UPI001455C9E7|nr:testis-specific gene 10 protein-like [Asterias rubens]
MEESIRQLQDEKTSLVQDLTAVRDLCIKLENTKEVMSRQLTTRNIDTEQLESSVDDQRREIEMLRNQVGTERASVRNLETLLSNNREKEFQAQLDSQEHRSEIQLVKDRLALADSKVQSQSRELQTLRSRAAQLEADLEKVRRQLTSERFEKERISQEFRRSTLSPTIADNSSFTRTSLMSNHNSSTRRSSSPHRPSSPTRRALSPSRSGRRSPERSILKSSPGYRSSSPDRRRCPFICCRTRVKTGRRYRRQQLKTLCVLQDQLRRKLSECHCRLLAGLQPSPLGSSSYTPCNITCRWCIQEDIERGLPSQLS